MADKATAPIASQLLRALAMHQRMTRSALPSVTHYGGSQNLLLQVADTASRSFSTFHHSNARGLQSHSDKQFLTALNYIFSLSEFQQMPVWQVVTRLPR